MRAIMAGRRQRRVRLIAVEIEKSVVPAVPTANDPVKSDLDLPKKRIQPQFGTKPRSPQMA